MPPPFRSYSSACMGHPRVAFKQGSPQEQPRCQETGLWREPLLWKVCMNRGTPAGSPTRWNRYSYFRKNYYHVWHVWLFLCDLVIFFLFEMIKNAFWQNWPPFLIFWTQSLNEFNVLEEKKEASYWWSQRSCSEKTGFDFFFFFSKAKNGIPLHLAKASPSNAL